MTATFGTTTVVPMYDDGAHGDGAAGDGVYGATSPPRPPARWSATTSPPPTTPAWSPPIRPARSAYYSYVVGQTTSTVQLNELMANPTTFTATTDYPTQTVGTLINTSSAHPGYTLVDPMHGHDHLPDQQRRAGRPFVDQHLPAGPQLLPAAQRRPHPGGLAHQAVSSTPGGGEGGIIEERDWNGNLFWSYVCEGTQSNGVEYMQHHDFQVLPNGDILMLVVELYTDAQALAAGFNPSLLNSTITTGGIEADGLMEVQPSGTTGGNIVWQWNVWDHLVQNYSSSREQLRQRDQPVPDQLQRALSAAARRFRSSGTTSTAIDYNAALDEIIISARNESEVWIIDHSTTTAQAASHTGGTRGHGGDLLYRWGNPQEYGAGTAANEMLYQQHDAQWIPAGYPGAGDILVFNNGDNRPGGNYTSIDEFTPASDGNGNYTTPATGSAYGPIGRRLDLDRHAADELLQFRHRRLPALAQRRHPDQLRQQGRGVGGEFRRPDRLGVPEPVLPAARMLYQGDALPADPHNVRRLSDRHVPLRALSARPTGRSPAGP